MVNVPLAYSAAFFAGSPDLRSFDNPVMPRNLKLSQRARLVQKRRAGMPERCSFGRGFVFNFLVKYEAMLKMLR
jgi:hypothetical protein